MTLSVREKILVISPTIPRPDMNSGDLRLYSILEILSEAYEVTFVARGIGRGDDAYVALLEKRGVTVRMESYSLKSLLISEKFKIAILEFYFTAEYYLDRIRILQPECRVVIDSVDVHFLRLKLKHELTKDKADYAVFRETRERELSVYRDADTVITVTSDDATALLREVPEITCEVVPNIHQIKLNDTPPPENTLIFVGGFLHKPNIDAVQYFCSEILPLIKHDKPNLLFTVVGSNPPEEIRKLESESIRVTGYVPETTTYLHNSRVSVAPIRYGAGMKGKIGEAMGHGVPVVTTSIGSQGMGLTNRKDIMIADTPHSFATAVLELLNDECLYETIRANASRKIEENYTAKQVARTMTAALERICTKPVKKMKLYEKIAFLNEYLAQRIKAKIFSC